MIYANLEVKGIPYLTSHSFLNSCNKLQCHFFHKAQPENFNFTQSWINGRAFEKKFKKVLDSIQDQKNARAFTSLHHLFQSCSTLRLVVTRLTFTWCPSWWTSSWPASTWRLSTPISQSSLTSRPSTWDSPRQDHSSQTTTDTKLSHSRCGHRFISALFRFFLF